MRYGCQVWVNTTQPLYTILTKSSKSSYISYIYITQVFLELFYDSC